MQLGAGCRCSMEEPDAQASRRACWAPPLPRCVFAEPNGAPLARHWPLPAHPEVQREEGVVREQAVAAGRHHQVPAQRRVAAGVRLADGMWRMGCGGWDVADGMWRQGRRGRLGRGRLG